MTIRPFARNIALASGAGLAVVPMAFAASPSLAATDCGTGTEVSAGICEVSYTTAGDYTFTAPASVSKMSAILVGAGQGGAVNDYGAGSFIAYGGGGGGVLFVDSVDVSAPIEITVGAGGANDFSSGGDTTLGTNTATGGGSDTGGQSGSPQDNAGFVFDDGIHVAYGSGGGAGGTPTDCVAGLGLTASAAADGSSLFPSVLGEPAFGEGGSCSGIALGSAPTPGKGGDVYSDGGSFAADAGEDGAVILRWSPTLPDTGLSVQPWMVGASAAALIGGAVLASGLLRTRRQGRHSA